jgi:Fe-Mn family superoxide dismutase
MKTFETKEFKIGELKGISAKAIEAHLKLYAGYVKNVNAILLKMEEYTDEASLVAGTEQQHALAMSELQRRFSFEFDGMRNHEYYFNHLEGGSTALAADSALMKAIEAEWGSFDAWCARFKQVAMTRGVGWAMLYYDKVSGRLFNNWNEEQHLGHLTGLSPILCLDMWEHSFLLDYMGDKKKYIDDFFENLNWSTCEENFAKATQ